MSTLYSKALVLGLLLLLLLYMCIYLYHSTYTSSWTTEYSSSFLSPLCMNYVNGAWQGARASDDVSVPFDATIHNYMYIHILYTIHTHTCVYMYMLPRGVLYKHTMT